MNQSSKVPMSGWGAMFKLEIGQTITSTGSLLHKNLVEV